MIMYLLQLFHFSIVLTFLCNLTRTLFEFHKKSEKQKIEDFRPVSLLLILDKTCERLIFNEMFNFFSANKLMFKNQSNLQGFELNTF